MKRPSGGAPEEMERSGRARRAPRPPRPLPPPPRRKRRCAGAPHTRLMATAQWTQKAPLEEYVLKKGPTRIPSSDLIRFRQNVRRHEPGFVAHQQFTPGRDDGHAVRVALN